VWQWLLAINPAFKQYEASFLDEQVTGKRLVRPYTSSLRPHTLVAKGLIAS
jgi:hypothetical protein